MKSEIQNQIKVLLEQNQHLFKPPGGPASSRGGTDHRLNAKSIDPNKMHWTWGKCYPIAQLVFYYLGGYQSDWDLMLIKKLPVTVNGSTISTPHWFVRNKIDGRIIDLSADQFYGHLDITEWYPKARRGNLGYPWFTNKDGERIQLGHTAPSRACIRLYDLLRVHIGTSEFLEYIWQNMKQFHLSKYNIKQDI